MLRERHILGSNGAVHLQNRTRCFNMCYRTLKLEKSSCCLVNHLLDRKLLVRRDNLMKSEKMAKLASQGYRPAEVWCLSNVGAKKPITSPSAAVGKRRQHLHLVPVHRSRSVRTKKRSRSGGFSFCSKLWTILNGPKFSELYSVWAGFQFWKWFEWLTDFQWDFSF